MPNWCYNAIIIEEGNKPELEKLHTLIQNWTSQSFVENDFGDKWLGNIVYGAGLKRSDEDEDNGFKCRGSIIDMTLDEENGILDIKTETAWGPMNGMWHAIIEKFAPNSFFQCCSEESGTGLYYIEEDEGCTRYFEHDYYVDTLITNCDNLEPWMCKLIERRYCTKLYIGAILKKEFGKQPIEELVETANNYMKSFFKKDGFARIYKYERAMYDPKMKKLEAVM